MQYTSLVYTIYIAPVLSFVAQLEKLPSNWKDIESQALGALLPGPNGWCRPCDTHNFKEAYGMKRSFDKVEDISTAARTRVHRMDAGAQGGHHVDQRYRELQEWKMYSDFSERIGFWGKSWIYRCYIENLYGVHKELSDINLSVRSHEQSLAESIKGSDPEIRAKAFKKTYQRSLFRHIKDQRVFS